MLTGQSRADSLLSDLQQEIQIIQERETQSFETKKIDLQGDVSTTRATIHDLRSDFHADYGRIKQYLIQDEDVYTKARDVIRANKEASQIVIKDFLHTFEDRDDQAQAIRGAGGRS